MLPSDAVRPGQAIPLPGPRWGVRAVAVWVPLVVVRAPATVLQLLVVDDPGLGAAWPAVGMAARWLMPGDHYVATLARGAGGGMGVSLLRLQVTNVQAVVANEAAASVAPESPVWLTGVDLAVLHCCRGDLLARVREGAWEPEEPAASFTRPVCHAQSAYLAAVRAKFAAAGVSGGLGTGEYEAKIQLAADGTFLRMTRRLWRGDPRASLQKLLEEEEPRCLAEVMPIVQVDPCAADSQRRSAQPGGGAVGTGEPLVAAEHLGFGWGPEWHTPFRGSGRDEVVRTEPQHAGSGIEPDVDACVSAGPTSPAGTGDV